MFHYSDIFSYKIHNISLLFQTLWLPYNGSIFGNEYLRRPNNEDTERLLQMGVARGFPGMLGSIDCMH